MTTQSVKKGTILQRKGDTQTQIYVVESGLLRSYIIDKKGKEHIFMFAPEGWVIADHKHPDLPTDLFIDALEDSVIRIREKNLEKDYLMAKPVVKRLYALQKRVLMLMSSSALDRYQYFVDTYPDILQRVPQRMVASYLGITPETLSKIKKESMS